MNKLPRGYYKCDVPSGNGRCSDNSCPCSDTIIPRGTGYLYITQENVDFRRQYPSEQEAKQAMENKIAQLRSQYAFVSGIYCLGPILCCEEAAKLRQLDLKTAAADAKYWWETGLVPLRPTPLMQKPSEKSPQPTKSQPQNIQEKNQVSLGLKILGSLIIITTIGIFAGSPIEDEIFWRMSHKTNTVEAVRNYIDKHPQGRHLIEAKQQLEELVWQQTVEKNNIKDYQDYLNKYPNGVYAQDARAGIEELEWKQAVKQNVSQAYQNYLEKYPEGIHALDAQINALDTNSFNAYFNRGNIWLDEKNYKQAEKDYSQAIVQCTDNLIQSCKTLSQAMVFDPRLLTNNPGLADAYYQRGLVYIELFENNKALADLEKAANLYQKQGREFDYHKVNLQVCQLRGIPSQMNGIAINCFR